MINNASDMDNAANSLQNGIKMDKTTSNINRLDKVRKICKNLDPPTAFVNVCFTATHPNRKGGTAIDGETDHQFHSNEEYVGIRCTNDTFIFDLVHHVANGKGTRDSIRLPSLDSLENLVEILKDLQDEKW